MKVLSLEVCKYRNFGLSGCTTMPFPVHDFSSVVLIGTLPGALNSFSLPMPTLLFCFVESCFMVPALTLNWIHTKIISAAAFRIICSTKS